MEFYRFDNEVGKKITKFNSDFIMSRIVISEKPVHIGCMYLEKNGIIGYHQATTKQLLLVVNGEGLVRGEKEEKYFVKSGDVIFWEKDEWHETTTENGLTAIVIEGEELEPALFMKVNIK